MCLIGTPSIGWGVPWFGWIFFFWWILNNKAILYQCITTDSCAQADWFKLTYNLVLVVFDTHIGSCRLAHRLIYFDILNKQINLTKTLPIHMLMKCLCQMHKGIFCSIFSKFIRLLTRQGEKESARKAIDRVSILSSICSEWLRTSKMHVHVC